MDINLRGKNAIIGGASKGIGRAISKQLAFMGANVTLLSRSTTLLAELMGELDKSQGQDHEYQVVDYTKREELKKVIGMLARSKNYHILINNTGGPAGGPIIDAEPDEFVDAFEKHIVAAQIMTQLVVPGMRKDKYGRIINIISTSVKQPIPNLGVSNTIRAAMANWAKTMASELGKDGITVNNVLPGFTDTDRLASIISTRAEKGGISEQKAADAMMSNVPLGRFAQPEETAYAVGFLASPSAAYINGINLPVDGGRTKSL